VERRIAFDADPAGVAAEWERDEETLRHRLAAHARSPSLGPLAPDLGRSVSALCASVGAEGLRADLVICRAAAALADWEGRACADAEDVRRVAPLALAHRRRSPLGDGGIDAGELEDALERLEEPLADPGEERVASIGDLGTVPQLTDGGPPGWAGQASGRRRPAEGPRGRLVGDRRPDGPDATVRSVALGATAAAVASRVADGGASGVGPEDLREAVREQRVANLVVLVVDASGSMGVGRRMEAAKGAVLSLLLDAYQRRDRVALVTFRGQSAEVVLQPTGSVEVARARLASLVTGGRTPLAEGIATALQLAERARSGPYQPLVVLVSDGRATAGAGGVDAVDAAHDAAASMRRRGVAGVVVDAEEGPVRLGLARPLAEAMGARYLTVAELSAGTLAGAVRSALG
jgi:magnesium chelatase subunit D